MDTRIVRRIANRPTWRHRVAEDRRGWNFQDGFDQAEAIEDFRRVESSS